MTGVKIILTPKREKCKHEDCYSPHYKTIKTYACIHCGKVKPDKNSALRCQHKSISI